jgi:hypothetical protein
MPKIGDILHHYEEWRGRSNYMDGWQSLEITGETKFSWLLKAGWREHKVNKKTMLENNGQWGNIRWFTDEGRDGQIWRKEHGPAIYRAMQRYDLSISQLKRIKAILDEPEDQ